MILINALNIPAFNCKPIEKEKKEETEVWSSEFYDLKIHETFLQLFFHCSGANHTFQPTTAPERHTLVSNFN